MIEMILAITVIVWGYFLLVAKKENDYIKKENEKLRNENEEIRLCRVHEAMDMNTVDEYLCASYKDIMHRDAEFLAFSNAYKKFIRDTTEVVQWEYPGATWKFSSGFGDMSSFLSNGIYKIEITVGIEGMQYEDIRWIEVIKRKVRLIERPRNMTDDEEEIYTLLKDLLDEKIRLEDELQQTEEMKKTMCYKCKECYKKTTESNDICAAGNIVQTCNTESQGLKVHDDVKADQENDTPEINLWYAQHYMAIEGLKSKAKAEQKNSILVPKELLPAQPILDQVIEAFVVEWGYESTDLTEEGLYLQF